ncbi:MFS transporter [Patescibacteria group bacterium]
MIQFIGFSLISLFLPIYLFQIFSDRVDLVILYYLVGHLIYALILPLGVQYLNKIGLRRSLRISVLFAVSYYTCLALISYKISFVILAIIMVTLFRTFFWLPFHTDLAKFTDKKNRGKSVSLMWATSSFLGVIMPVIAGFLIGTLGYNFVFILAIMIYLASLIPFTALPRTKERYSWGYLETFKQFLAKKNRKLVLANMANGAENCIGIIIWPIFIFQLLKGNYFAVGAISSLIVFTTVILQLLVGKYTDIFDKRKMIHWGSILYASGWLAKVFVLTSFQIFIVGTYHNFTQIFKDTPFDALNYELLADHGHYVDEFTAIKEIAVQLGKVLMLILILLVIMNFGLNWAFALAALASLFINFL